jgi:DNA mismatch endonuclease (patch repair protein)
MSRVRQTGTNIELKVRKMVDKLGFAFETNTSSIPGSPDLSNLERRWAIFVHGCFWHAHEDCVKWKLPKQNRDFWKKKFERNRERDKRKIQSLQSEGYNVLVIWECELNDAQKSVNRISDFLKAQNH